MTGRIFQIELVFLQLRNHAQHNGFLLVIGIAQQELDRFELKLLLAVGGVGRLADRARAEQLVAQCSLIDDAVSLQEQLDFGVSIGYCGPLRLNQLFAWNSLSIN